MPTASARSARLFSRYAPRNREIHLAPLDRSLAFSLPAAADTTHSLCLSLARSQTARRALAVIFALTSDAEPAADELAAALEAQPAAPSIVPRFDEVLTSPTLQSALARRQAAIACAADDGDQVGTSEDQASMSMPAGGVGTLAGALAALAPFDDAAVMGGEAPGLAALDDTSRVLARDMRRQNAEMLLAAPTHGAKRIGVCCTQMLACISGWPLDRLGHAIKSSSVGSTSFKILPGSQEMMAVWHSGLLRV